MSQYLLERVARRYPQAGGAGRDALRVPQLQVEQGEILAVLGPNGSGKSTLLETMAFLARPDEGRLLFRGRDPWAGGDALQARRRCPMLLQRTVLFSGSVQANASFGPRMLGLSAQETARRAHEALRWVGMEELASRRHDELSGGEARRVALARILALQGEVLLLDEPTAGLDVQAALELEKLILRLNRQRGTTVILTSHSLRQATKLAQRIVTMADGRLIPANMDNRTLGHMTRVAEGWRFQDHRGWQHLFREADLARDDWADIGPRQGAVQVAVCATDVLVRPWEEGAAGGLRGEVRALRQVHSPADARSEGERSCLLRVGLAGGPRLRALLGEAGRITLGTPVSLGFRPRSVYVLPARGGSSPNGTAPGAGR